MATPVGSTEYSAYPGKTSFEEKSSLGKDDFLKILVTQLQNQDPLQPMQDREFIAQMTQFSTLEQLTNMNALLTSMAQANQLGSMASLIGKEVKWFNDGLGGWQTGLVSAVSIQQNKAFLVMDSGDKVPAANIMEIADAGK